ncbi:MAG: sulfite exporter TauE/SafE family protein [Geminicoccales bacterium]
MLAAMDILIIAYSIACIFGAAVVRGYSGFGFSLLAITALSLALPPAEIVPSIFMLEIAASLHLLPGIWRDIHWRAIGLLLIGCAVATPIGVQLLANLPAAPMRIALSVFVVIAVAFLWHGFAFKAMPGPVATVATGVISGLCNGAFGIGGPPAILLFFSARASVAISRASVIAYFLGTDILGLAFLAEADLTTRDTLWRFLMFMPPLLAGVWLGAHSFKHADPASFRRWVLRILVLLALLTAMQGAVQLLDLMPSKGPAAT